MYEEYKFKCSGDDLAKVLWYYGLIPDVRSMEYKIICPLHEDVNPSMLINLEEGSYFCFGCYESGDALQLVRAIEKRNGLNDLQALQKYFKILKSKKCKALDLGDRVKKRKKSSKQAFDESCDYYYGLSKVNWLKETGNEEIIKAREYMKQRGFGPKTLNACQAKVTYNQMYGIVFPMLDNGEFKGWVCRTMVPEVEKKRKYLYNEGFSRATTLVGNYGSDEVLFVVEGYMDRLKFIQNGITNVVAILGWKMSHEQIEKIKVHDNIKVIVSALDNDKYGKKGSKYLEQIFPHKCVRFKYMKGIKDPGEMNPEQFKKMYNKTLDAIRSTMQQF